ncbi:MAG TPA: response regulator [Verrucomicrobiae bacterium]|nr:response regulator [Verrucomicrobiae bacterium]
MKKLILIVDDDSQIRESLGKVFGSEGYEVEFATDGHDTINRFIERRPDLVLLDLSLPGSSGWDVFGAITSFDPFLPIVIITGRQNQLKFAIEAGAGALMEKPLDVPLLLSIIARLIADEPETHVKRLIGISPLKDNASIIPAL